MTNGAVKRDVFSFETRDDGRRLVTNKTSVLLPSLVAVETLYKSQLFRRQQNELLKLLVFERVRRFYFVPDSQTVQS